MKSSEHLFEQEKKKKRSALMDTEAVHLCLLQMFNCITELVLRAKKEVLAKQQQQQQNDVVKLTRNSKRKKKCC